MPIASNCSTCKGTGRIYALVSQHDDKKEWVECPHCGLGACGRCKNFVDIETVRGQN